MCDAVQTLARRAARVGGSGGKQLPLAGNFPGPFHGA